MFRINNHILIIDNTIIQKNASNHITYSTNNFYLTITNQLQFTVNIISDSQNIVCSMKGINNLPTQYPLYASSLKQNQTGIYGERLCLDKDYTAQFTCLYP